MKRSPKAKNVTGDTKDSMGFSSRYTRQQSSTNEADKRIDAGDDKPHRTKPPGDNNSNNSNNSNNGFDAKQLIMLGTSFAIYYFLASGGTTPS